MTVFHPEKAAAKAPLIRLLGRGDVGDFVEQDAYVEFERQRPDMRFLSARLTGAPVCRPASLAEAEAEGRIEISFKLEISAVQRDSAGYHIPATARYEGTIASLDHSPVDYTLTLGAGRSAGYFRT